MKPTDDQQPKPNGFLAVLQRKELQDGLLTTLSERLGEAALAAKKSGKKATLQLTITLEPEKDALAVGAVIGAKIPPTEEQSLTIFYVDEQGALHRNDPTQREFELRSHDGGATEPEGKTEAAAAN